MIEKIAGVLPAGTVLLVGSARINERRDKRGMLIGRDAYNSLMAIDSDGRVVDVYDKIHLVPFGEYLPFQAFLESLGVMQMTGVRGGFSAGAGPRLLKVPGVPHTLPLICYEIIFPGEIGIEPGRRGEGEQPGWMLNVTNDAWFGSSAGPYQHFHQARVRAVEQGLPLARAANTGISAVVDPKGRILADIALDEKGVIDAEIPARGPATVYTLWGSRIEVFVFVLAFLGWLTCLWRSALRP